VVRRKYSRVAIWEHWSPEEREKAEKWHKLTHVIYLVKNNNKKITLRSE
jgi:hypothetical protein